VIKEKLTSLDLKKEVIEITSFIKKMVEEAGAKGTLVGLSGGVDSSVVATLCVKALGNDRVIGLIMPEDFTPKRDIQDAEELAGNLKIKLIYVPISPIVSSFVKTLNLDPFQPYQKKPLANLRARVRMVILYYYANLYNYLVAGTGDKSEDLIGYFCYDSYTRAFTKEGLKYYWELKPGDKVLSLNLRNGEVEEKEIKKVYIFDYSGKMLSFNGFLVTPNHRMLTLSQGKLKFIRAENCINRSLDLPKPKQEKQELKDNLKEYLYSLGFSLSSNLIESNLCLQFKGTLFQLPSSQLLWIYRGILEGNGGKETFYTYSEEFALNLVELAIRIGKNPILRKEGRLYLVKMDELNKINFEGCFFYSGKVWCPDVPENHNLLVERNGRFIFCGNTKYGDGGVDFLPIAHLYKTQVRLLAEYLGIPKHIAYKPSSPQLYPGHKATDEIPLDYEDLDPILYGLFDLKLSPEEVSKLTNQPLNLIQEILEMHRKSEHKRIYPKMLKSW